MTTLRHMSAAAEGMALPPKPLSRTEALEHPASPAEAHEPPRSLAAKVRTLLRGRWGRAIALAVALGVALGLLGWRNGSQTFVSRGQVHVAAAADDFGFDDAAARAPQNYDAFADTQVQFLRSSRVIDKALENPAWRELGRRFSEREVRQFADGLQVTRKGELILLEVRDGSATAAYTGVRSVLQAYEQLIADQEAERAKGKVEFLESELARSTNRLGQLDAAVRAKMRDIPGLENFGPDDVASLFVAKLAEANATEGRLRAVRQELAQRGVTTPTSTPTPDAGPAEATAAFTATAAPKPAAPVATKPTTAPVRLDPEEIALESPQMATLLGQRRELDAKYRRLTMVYGEGHEAIKAAEADRKALDDEIASFAARYSAWRATAQGGDRLAGTETDGLVRLEHSLSSTSREVTASLDTLTRVKRDVQDLRDQIEQERGNRDDLRHRIDVQNRLSRLQGRIQVVDSGTKPIEALTDTRARLAGLGGAGGVAAGFGVFLVLGLLDRRVRGVDDALRPGLGRRPVLGLLPELPAGGIELDSSLEVAHWVHRIRNMLQVWYGGMRHPVFAVTGPMSGSGKTTVTLALGLSFAAAGSRTLLIDLDLAGGGLTSRARAVRRPRLGYVLRRRRTIKAEQLRAGLEAAEASGSRLGEALVRLGCATESDVTAALDHQRSRRLGVLDVVRGAPLGRCVAPTEYPRLSILPLGDATAGDVGTMSPAGVQRLLDAARAAYDVILVDTGPLPGSLEASSAAAAADGVVLTVSRGDERVELDRCVRHLEAIVAHVAGVVFNRASAAEVAAAGGAGSSAGSQAAAGERGGDDSAEVSRDDSREVVGKAAKRGFGPFADAVALTSDRRDGRGRS